MIAFCERNAVREEEQRIADTSSPGHEVLARVAALGPEIEELDAALGMKALQC